MMPPDPAATRFGMPMDAEWAAIALVRMLFATGVEEGEARWQWDAALHEAGSRAGGPAWFEIDDGTDIPRFIRIADSSGQYTRNRPTEIERAGLPLHHVVVPPRPHRTLRSALPDLLDRLPAQRGLVMQRDTLQAALDHGETNSAFAAESRNFITAYLASPDPQPCARLWRARLRERFFAFQLTGPVAGGLLAAVDLLSGFAELPVPLREQLQDLVPGRPCALLDVVLASFNAIPELHPALLEVIDAWDDEGRGWIDRQLAATEESAFMGAAYASVAPLYAAWSVCDVTARTSGVDRERADRFRSFAVGFEEEWNLSTTVLLVDLHNALDGRVLMGHRAQILQAREDQGPGAAQGLWDDLCLRKRLYPPFWRAFLFGETEILPDAIASPGHGPQ